MNPWAKMAADNQVMLKKPLKGQPKEATSDQVYDSVMDKAPQDAWWMQDPDTMWESDSPYAKARAAGKK